MDEYTCIGCTHCSHTAPSTFFMENEHGRARVYQQGRDTEEAVSNESPLGCARLMYTRYTANERESLVWTAIKYDQESPFEEEAKRLIFTVT